MRSPGSVRVRASRIRPHGRSSRRYARNARSCCRCQSSRAASGSSAARRFRRSPDPPFTGARSSEIAGVKWEWIRGARAFLPDAKTSPHSVPLAWPRGCVSATPGARDPHAFLFRCDAEGRGQSSLTADWRAVWADAKCGELRLHDLRHSWPAEP